MNFTQMNALMEFNLMWNGSNQFWSVVIVVFEEEEDDDGNSFEKFRSR